MKVPRKIVDKTEINRIRSQQIREFCDILPINKSVEIRRRGWDEHVTRMNAKRLVKILRHNLTAGRRFPGHRKRRWSDLIPDLNTRNHLQQTRRRRRVFNKFSLICKLILLAVNNVLFIFPCR